jgi:hypothetical protein
MKRDAGGAGAVLLAAALAWGVTLAGVAGIAYGWDVRGFYVSGTEHRHPPELAGGPVRPGSGYDGQFFGALAVDPLLLRPETPDFLDLPAYRAGRIGLPLAAWSLVLGNRPAALVAYLVLSWLLGLLGIWVAARWLKDAGRSPWGSFPLALSVGLVAAMMRGVPDAAAASLVLLALWREARHRPGAVGLLAAASLVRETSILAVGALVLVRWRQGRWRDALRAAIVPTAVVLSWRGWVAARPGFGFGVPKDIWVPFSWLPTKLAPPRSLDSIAEAFALAALAVAAVALVPLLPRWRDWSPVAWTYAGTVLLMLILGEPIYRDLWAFARVGCALPLLAVALATEEDRPVVGRLLRAVPLAYAAAGAVALFFTTRLPAVLHRLIAS